MSSRIRQKTLRRERGASWKARFLFVFFFLFALYSFVLALKGCGPRSMPMQAMLPAQPPALTEQDVQRLMAQAVDVARQMNEKINVAVVDREGNVLGVFHMNGAGQAVPAAQALLGEIAKARTAAYLSSNQHGFTTLTACFITRGHFPPTASNTAAGPLFGVPFSQLPTGDVQPNGGPLPPLGPPQPNPRNIPGLTSISGGVPVYKNGALAGGLGISGGSDTFVAASVNPAVASALLNSMFNYCQGVSRDEIIALAAVRGYEVPRDRRGDTIMLDGIQLLYANTEPPAFNLRLTFDSLATLGTVDPAFPIRATPPPRLPMEGEVRLDATRDFRIKAGRVLSADEVRQIINQAVARANRTRAAIRRPPGSAARVVIAVSDIDGTLLGIWRMADAPTFSLDVAAQKARSAVAFSDPNDALGQQMRTLLGLSAGAPLAVSTRAFGFLSQRYYPPGIDLGAQPQTTPVESGPFYQNVDAQFDFTLQQTMQNRPPFINGIQIFPGGIPLYKNGQLAGGIGVSGDGVEQDDYIAAGGAQGFEPPPAIRTDQYSYRNVKLPYLKFPRQPELP
ncbi:MAG: heme-binding protein [candidate division KSB1 bacterium]|nr:heme-binding protein [candidate division KSB1 bacterium]MDZ7274985.1 heme-binding protein [candidate division KSB1 bacterium]MDZ7286564.1 heme-binding protein [candidate division KSB1 bacterium]MDZ7299272.1 heme-binding protein [candidate division KSB1 bacterium]MDZ7306068.1 heme-binding protein [candidate division KSB1 bacterium]